MKYHCVSVTRRGGPEKLEVIARELHPPGAGEARIKILATPVCQDDIAVRQGNRPFLKKPPFVPGYSTLGVVDAIGEGVENIEVGDRVAALIQFGGYAEYIYWNAEELVKVPETLDPAEARLARRAVSKAALRSAGQRHHGGTLVCAVAW